jgi:hypothetical protein
MKASIVILALMLALPLTCMRATRNFSNAALVNWSEVTRFSGPGDVPLSNTTDFAVDYPEWRIRWEYTPDPQYPGSAGLTAMAYSRTQPGGAVNEIFALGTADANGTSYVHNKTGIFYLTMTVSPYDVNYKIIIEQDLDSVPEYPSSTLVLLIVIAASLIIVAHRGTNRNVIGCAHKRLSERASRPE